MARWRFEVDAHELLLAPDSGDEVARERMVLANLRLGMEAYERLLGLRPEVALINEQAYSAGLVSLYREAGYRAVAPDQRGYGRSSRPEPVTDYDIHHLTGDMVALLDRLGEEPRPTDDDAAKSLRASLLRTAAVVGADKAAAERCAELRTRYLQDSSTVEASLGTAALAASAAAGDLALHKRLEEAFSGAGTPQERERILHAFGAFRDPDALQRTLELSLSGTIRSQDAPYLLRDALANRDNGGTAWQFVADNWSEINSVFPSNSISRMLGGIRAVRERTTADAVASFLEQNPVPQGQKQVSQHIERMWVSVALTEREAERFPEALSLADAD
jgi:hypothetical protein